MASEKSTFPISTSVDKDSDSVTTQVTVDWEGLTFEQLKANFFTSTSPRVGLQARLRNMKGGIPAKIEVKAVDLVGKSRPAIVREMTPQEIENAALEKAMQDPVYKADLLKRLQALGIKK
jgi:hypothetical protein